MSLPNISEAKQALLAKYLRGEIEQQATSPRSISPRASGSPLHLSFAQERIWFLDQLNPNSAVFNVPLTVPLAGAIDTDVLKRSVNEIVRRHDVLRTTFRNVDGQPELVVTAELHVALPFVDLTSCPEPLRAAQLRSLLSEEEQTPFDLARGPLIRTRLFRLAENEHRFVVNLHHIVSDGWSLVLFFQELSTIYEAFSRGEQSPLAGVAVQYSDYAVWQREWLQGELLQKQLNYWKTQLGGDLPLLELPTDRPRPVVQTFKGAREWLSLSQELTDSVLALSQREGATLFMTLLATFKVLLHHYCGQEDVIVGSPIANRPQTETESLIGFFLNNLALRTDLSGDPSFREALARVRKTALEAYANQDVPFEKLIEALKPERDLSRTPIFQVYFNLFNFGAAVRLPGSDQTVSFVEAWAQSDEELSKFDLTLYAGLQDRELKLAFVYNTDLFDAGTVALMLAHFRNLLEAAVANPEKCISELSLRREGGVDRQSQSHRVRPDNSFVEFRKEEIEQSIADRFATQVKNYPHRLAVKSRNHEWSYAELDATVNRITQIILRLQGDGEEHIPLLFEHDAPMVAGMLGALRAGKTYVPLDPHHPEERLRQIIEHSQATALLTNDKNLFLAKKLTKNGLQLINIDAASSNFQTPAALPEVPPDRLAYILYTSGSTGQPKGVMQNHRNVLHYIRVYTNNLHLNADDRLSLLSSYCFDASVMDIYGALLNGATLCPVDIKEEGLAGLPEQLIAEGITVYHSTPTVYRYFLNELGGQSHSAFPDLRLVVLGGEKVNRADVELYKQHFSKRCLFVNGLGPTEATVTLQNFIDKQTEIVGDSVPVGFPVEDTEVLLLNKAGKPAEVSGEIAIRSAHVALGYWRNEEATAAAFVSTICGPGSPDGQPGWGGDSGWVAPRDSNANGHRIYRTGDMGRRLPDGSIKFEGRKDFQIKIRGFRVELGEIESALASSPQVREAAVVALDNGSGDTKLVAYVVPREPPANFLSEPGADRGPQAGSSLGVVDATGSQVWPTNNSVATSTESIAANASITTELREFLKHSLPEYMVPASFVLLDSLPLTPSGKLNRRALPAPATFDAQQHSISFAAPKTQLERVLTTIWSELLAVKAIGVNDNFFELGGHSLLAVRLFAQIEKRLGKRLPLATLFQAPTVAQLASVIQKDWTPAWSSLVEINPIEAPSSFGRALGRGLEYTTPAMPLFPGPSPNGRREDSDVVPKPPFFCVHALGGHVLEYYDLARHLGGDQPFYGLQSAGLDGSRPPHTRVEDMATHYIREMRELQPEGPYFIGGRSLGGMVAFEIARQLKAQGHEVGLLALLDTYPSGYAKLFANKATLRAALGRGLKRTQVHLANLSGLSHHEKFYYVINKARFAPDKLRGHIWRRLYSAYEKVGRPLPRALRDIKEFNSLAVRSYTPQVYDGKVTLFWASADLRSSRDLVEGWRALAGGGIEVHEIPGSHLDIVKEPHVGDLASKLTSCLHHAQSA